MGDGTIRHRLYCFSRIFRRFRRDDGLYSFGCGRIGGLRRDFGFRFGLDDGLLLMVLLGAANWNNVEIASLLTCERDPDTQDPSIHNLMNWFRI